MRGHLYDYFICSLRFSFVPIYSICTEVNMLTNGPRLAHPSRSIGTEWVCVRERERKNEHVTAIRLTVTWLTLEHPFKQLEKSVNSMKWRQISHWETILGHYSSVAMVSSRYTKIHTHTTKYISIHCPAAHKVVQCIPKGSQWTHLKNKTSATEIRCNRENSHWTLEMVLYFIH